MAEVLAKAEKYINGEEALISKRGSSSTHKEKSKTDKQLAHLAELHIAHLAELHIAHLAESFQILKKYNMKLNPAKCAFEVSARKFLGFIVNNRGIEANPDKIAAAIKHKRSPTPNRKSSCAKPFCFQGQ